VEEQTVLVTVDYDRCEGHGLCTISAPDVFSFDARGSLQVVARPGAEQRAAVEESVRMCPALAISFAEEAVDAVGS
jgi:ferredoxin